MVLETGRLIIRPFQERDIDPYAQLVADPEVMKYITGIVQSSGEAKTYVMENIENQKKLGFSRYAVTLKENSTFIGFCGYKIYMGNMDLGWRYDKKYWNRGIGTEAAIAVLNYGIHTLNLGHIVCIAYPENVASLKIMQKIGLERKGEWLMPNGKTVIRYEY